MVEALEIAKQNAFMSALRAYNGLLVAYSGGIDSAYLAWAAHKALGERMCAVIADSASLPRTHLAEAIAFAEEHAIPLRIVKTEEMANPAYVRNDASRCFHCKDELFTVMEAELTRLGFHAIAYGRNTDDSGDFRPGQRAAANHRVLAPLVDAQLGKQEIRRLAQHAGLRIWDKPASACLSSRIQYGQPVTRETLAKIEQAEESLFHLGFRQTRVRSHDDLARIEIATQDLQRAFLPANVKAISSAVHAAGFRFVSIDCDGYRSGSMNDLLPAEAIAAARSL